MKHFTSQKRSEAVKNQLPVNADQLIAEKKKSLQAASRESWNAKFKLWTSLAASVATILFIAVLGLNKADAQANPDSIYYTNFGTTNGIIGACYGNWNHAGWTISSSDNAVINTLSGSGGTSNVDPYVSTLPASASGGAFLGEAVKAGVAYTATNCDSLPNGNVDNVTSVFTLNVSTTNYANIVLSFFYRISSNSYTSNMTNIDLSWSTDNSTWNSINIGNGGTSQTGLWDGSAGSMVNDGNWHPISYALPSGAQNAANLYLRWTLVRPVGFFDSNFKLDDYTVTGIPIPSIALGAVLPANDSISVSSLDNIIGGISLGVTNNNATLTGATVNTAGTYVTADFTNFKFWLSSSSTSILTATQLGSTHSSVSSGSALTVSGLSANLPVGTSYILVTGSVASGGVKGHTIRLASTTYTAASLGTTGNITFADAKLTGTNPIPGGASPTNDQIITTTQVNPSKLVITNIVPSSPVQDGAFSVTVTAEDAGGTPRNATTNTTITLTKYVGANTLYGTLTGTLTAGTYAVTFTGVKYNAAETGVEIKATASAGETLTAAISSAFTVLGKATKLVFSSFPSTGHDAAIINTFTVQALRADNSLDVNYTTGIILAKATGAGAITGTLTQPAVAGVATFNDIVLTDSGNVTANYTLAATSGSLPADTSSSIAITILTDPTPYVLSTGTYTFHNWPSSSPALTYPPNMIFHYIYTDGMGATDPNTSSDTAIEDYYDAYDIGSGTRINGLGGGGISFINSSASLGYQNDYEDGDLGEAVLALYTGGRKNIVVSWYDSTLNAANAGTSYKIKGQYRLGNTGSYTDLPHDSTPQIEYTSPDTGNVGHPASATFGPDTLPASCEDQPLVQLRWVYYQNGGKGTRAQISLDSIKVTSVPGTPEMDTTNTNGVFPNNFGLVNLGDSATHVPFDIYGRFLTGPITFTPPAGFQVKIFTNAYTLGAITVPLTADSVALTTMHVRFVPVVPGYVSGNVVMSSPGATSINIPVSGTGVCPGFTPHISGSPTYCNSGSTTIDAGSGYGGGSNTYHWSTSATTESISVGTAGTFSVTVTDVYGCSATATVTVSQSTHLTPSISGTNYFCAGSTTTLNAGDYLTYSWSPGGATTKTIAANSATTYTVSVTDAGGCSGTATLAITQKSLPNVAISGHASICNGVIDTLVATGAVDYSWNIFRTTNDTIIVQPLADSTFMVTGTDANNCVNTASLAVVVNPLPAVAVTPASAVLCSGGSSQGLTASGATTYAWSPSTGLSASTGASVTATPTVTTTYTVTGTESVHGCKNTATSAIYFITGPQAPATGGTITYCQGAPATQLTATPTPANANLLWYTASTGGTASLTAPTPSTATAGTTTYYVAEQFNNSALQIAVSGIVTNGTPDEFSFLALSNIPAGTVIYFTDNTWAGSSFNGYTPVHLAGSSGGLVRFTANQTINAGTTIQSYSINDEYWSWSSDGDPINPAHLIYGTYHHISLSGSNGGTVWAFLSGDPINPLGNPGQFLSAFDNTNGFVNSNLASTGLSTTAGTAVTLPQANRAHLHNDDATRSAYQWYQYIADTLTADGHFTITNGNSNSLPTDTFGVATACNEVSARVPISVVVNSGPTPGETSTATCYNTNSTIHLSVDPNNHYGDGGYQWSGPNNWTSTAHTPAIASATTAYTGYYTVVVTETDDGCSATQSLYVQVGNCTGADLNLKMFIQGYYLGKYYYAGGSMNAALYNQYVSGNSFESDTVQVSLVDSASSTIKFVAKGVLQIGGALTVNFPSTVVGHKYYIVLDHRNSAETWSALTVLMASTTSYDFTTAASKAYGSFMADLGDGNFGIFSGDINQDGFIDGNDFPFFDADNFAGLQFVYSDDLGYSTDLNGDGFVDGNDFPVFDLNNFNGQDPLLVDPNYFGW